MFSAIKIGLVLAHLAVAVSREAACLRMSSPYPALCFHPLVSPVKLVASAVLCLFVTQWPYLGRQRAFGTQILGIICLCLTSDLLHFLSVFLFKFFPKFSLNYPQVGIV